MSEQPENWSRLHPATLAIRALEQLPQFVLGLPAAAYFIGNTGIVVALFFALVGVGVSVGLAYIYWLRFAYHVGEEQLIIESGVFNRNRRTIPFDRIQDVSLEQKLLARVFGVSVARIETGGSGGDEGELDCISREEADRLRDRIRAYRAGSSADADTADEAAVETEPVLYTMSAGRLAIAGLFNFSLVFLAVLGGVWQYVGSYLPSDYLDPRQWIDAYGDQALGMMTALPIVGFFALLIAIGAITGLVRTFAREFGFRLTRTETGLRRQRGLFTRTDVVIPLKRVQAVVISTSILKRFFGWRGMALQSLGTDGGAGTNHVVAPLAYAEDLQPILDELHSRPPPPDARFERVSPKLIYRSWLEDGIVLAAIIAGVSFFWSGGPWLLLLVPLFAIAPVLQYRAHGYCIEGELLFVRRGFWRPRITILPLNRVQSASLVRGLTQRGFGIATLVIGSAGASLASPLKILDLDENAARKLLGRDICRV
ncbi:PH domain-containing protein [Parasphingopyxis sp.]|uniref:PH domain-containing protein n=1 Tax=Parasphingopyxis sp. TaxID=1920299 RepID=UPI00260659A1|nr:PH domain-containing protein [Parasphingopyxis sp.]